jgi:hypothetical protein
VGEPLLPDELEGVERVRRDLDGPLGASLAGMITARELRALAQRCDRLLARAAFPAPHGQMPSMPWPLF